MNYAHSKNIDLLDTALTYGNSEKILGKVNVSNFNVITKTRCFDNLKINDNDMSLLNSDFHYSLENLKQNNIYALLIHNAEDLIKPGEKLFQCQNKTIKKMINKDMFNCIQLICLIVLIWFWFNYLLIL